MDDDEAELKRENFIENIADNEYEKPRNDS